MRVGGVVYLLLLNFFTVQGFSLPTPLRTIDVRREAKTSPSDATEPSAPSRRQLLSAAFSASFGVVVTHPLVARAEDADALSSKIYLILRVREAAQQEIRLINSGKFKDVQRANVKLAVRFMLKNYRLADSFVAASGLLDDNAKRVAAGEAGERAVQNLYTILEYFDSSDVQNLKVSKRPTELKRTLSNALQRLVRTITWLEKKGLSSMDWRR